MKYGSKTAGLAVFIGMVMAGSFAQGAERTVSTVDSQELFRAHMVSDNKAPAGPDVAQAVDEAAASLPERNSRLRWAAVKTTAELAEEKKAVQRQTKAIPIIITAADVDKERKARKNGKKGEGKTIISPRPLETPRITPTPAPVPRPQTVKPAAGFGDVTELPPIQPVAGAPQLQAETGKEAVELPPVTPVQTAVPVETIMDAIVESTSIELVIDEVRDEQVELPAVQPVR